MPESSQTRQILIAAQCNDHSARLAGIPCPRFFTDPLAFTQTQLLVSEYYGFDAPNNTWDVYNIEAEAMGQKILFPEEGIPDAVRTDPLIKEPSDLERIRIPDPFRSGRMPWVHQVNKYYIKMTGKPAKIYFCAPFSLAVNVRGYENFVMDMLTDPDFAHRLLEFLCDRVIAPFIGAMRSESGNPGLLADGNDAWASPPLITLDMMDEFVIPYTERLRKTVGGKLVTRGNWGDAKSRDPERFMSQKLKASPGFLSVLDPDLHELGPERIKRFAQSQNAHITAGVDAVLLRNGPPETIIDRIRHYINAMGRDGRCAIYLNHIPGDTPPLHIHTAVAACKTLGRLPIPEDLSTRKVSVPERETFAEFLRLKNTPII